MAKVNLNPVLQVASGKLGGAMMFRRLADGRTLLCAKPDFSQRQFSRGQLSHQERFRAAAAYAKAAALTQPIYGQLAAGTLKTAYNLALSDWFHPPVVQRVEVQTGVIHVWASDDVCVAQVRVTILDQQGKVIQQGLAAQAQPDGWEFTPATKPGSGTRLVVEAQDLAGNVTRME